MLFSSGLIYITQLFSLYRLNWWPAALGARKSYVSFWLLSVGTGYALHVLAWDRLPSMGGGWILGDGRDSDGEDDEERIQWQRKTPWVALAFATMAMPAFVCLAGLRRGGRQTYRHSLTDTQKSECCVLLLMSEREILQCACAHHTFTPISFPGE
jgi:hypothetical protein